MLHASDKVKFEKFLHKLPADKMFVAGDNHRNPLSEFVGGDLINPLPLWAKEFQKNLSLIQAGIMISRDTALFALKAKRCVKFPKRRSFVKWISELSEAEYCELIASDGEPFAAYLKAWFGDKNVLNIPRWVSAAYDLMDGRNCPSRGEIVAFVKYPARYARLTSTKSIKNGVGPECAKKEKK